MARSSTHACSVNYVQDERDVKYCFGTDWFWFPILTGTDPEMLPSGKVRIIHDYDAESGQWDD